MRAYILASFFLSSTVTSAADIVTDENFARAETDLYFEQQVEQGTSDINAATSALSFLSN